MSASAPEPWTDYAALVEQRGYVIVYRRAEPNHCPGCGHSQWLVGRVTAECAHCGTALRIIAAPIPETASAKD